MASAPDLACLWSRRQPKVSTCTTAATTPLYIDARLPVAAKRSVDDITPIPTLIFLLFYSVLWAVVESTVWGRVRGWPVRSVSTWWSVPIGRSGSEPYQSTQPRRAQPTHNESVVRSATQKASGSSPGALASSQWWQSFKWLLCVFEGNRVQQ